MSQYIKQCPTNSNAISIINMMTEPMAESISKSLSYDAIMEEAEYLNKIEKNVPELLRIQIELNTLVKRRSGMTSYENLLESRSMLIDEVSDKFGEDEGNQLNESYKILSSRLKSFKMNEGDDSSNPFGKMVDTDISKALGGSDFKKVMKSATGAGKSVKNTINTGSAGSTDKIGKSFNDFFGHDEDKAKEEYKDSEENDKSVMGMLGRLYDDLTEGGSPIGILHLVLDILGVIGDIPLIAPIGLIADLLNAVIYGLRGKWVLCAISVVAATIPFAGPVIKNIFKGTKVGKETFAIFNKLLGKGGAAATKEGLELAAKASPGTRESIRYVAKLNKSAFTKATSILGKFFDQFIGAVVGWIPFIGPPLRKLFKRIGSFFDSFSKKVIKASDEVLQPITSKADAKLIDDFMKEAGSLSKGDGVLKASGDNLVLVREGMPDLKLSSELLTRGKNMKEAYGEILKNSIQNTGKKRSKKQISTSAVMRSADAGIKKFYVNLHEMLTKNEKLLKSANKWPGLSIKGNVKMLAFLGKQITKYLSEKSLIPDDQDELVQKGLAAIALKKTFQDITDKVLKDNPDASYTVPYVDNFTNNDAVKTIENAQNMYADALNLPKVGQIGYFAIRHSGNDCPPDVRDLFNKAYPELKDKKNAYEASEDLKESKTLKYIKGFDSFK